MRWIRRFAGAGIIWAFIPLAASSQTVSVFDVLVATNNLTVIGTTTINGSGFSVGGATLAVVQGNVGLGTTTPRSQFHMVGPLVGISSAQFVWIASRAALRAGVVTGGNWDLVNVGTHSIALGFNGLNTHPYGTISGGYSNQLNYGNGGLNTIGGGDANGIYGFYADASNGTVAGGQSNVIQSYSAGAIGGGVGNEVYSAGGTVAGGGSNSVGSNGLSNSYATVGGGAYNDAFGYASVIAGGGGVGPTGSIGGNATTGTGGAILGGAHNRASVYSSVGGGAFNLAMGDYAAIPGGYFNQAHGKYSFAGGSSATVTAKGTFAWADSQGGQLLSNTTDEFRVRAGGGYVLLSTPTSPTTIVTGTALLISTSNSAAGAVPGIYLSSSTGYLGLGTRNPAIELDVTGGARVSGQAIVQGTMTVQGAAFSVGGATFTVAGGSITLGGRLNLAVSGIQWADGSISTTAASGGGGGAGDMTLTSTQTVSGAKIFTSSVAAGPQVQTSTAITSASAVQATPSAVFVNAWTLVASTITYNATRATLYGLRQGATYRLEWAYLASVAGVPNITFNHSASVYQYAANGWRSDGSAITTNSTSGTECNFTGGGAVGANQEARGEYTFRIYDTDDTRVLGFGKHAHVDGQPSPQMMNVQFGCYYDGSSAVSSIQFAAATNGVTGYFKLYEQTTATP